MNNHLSNQDSFADYQDEAGKWITLATGEYYPDVLEDACSLYQPVQELFDQMLKSSESSSRLFLQTTEAPNPWMRIQLARIFKRYVSPTTPVEMLKKKTKARQIINDYGDTFRPIQEVQEAWDSRGIPDEALCALLWEYKDRGQPGYNLTERFFDQFEELFPDLRIYGPRRAGPDVSIQDVFPDFPNDRPVDFVIDNPDTGEVLAVGWGRYDSDRGGAQEDDRTGGYKHTANEVLSYAKEHGLRTKVVFVNDGPGLLLGSMWDDYVELENSWPGRIKVVTLRMVPERLTHEWLFS